MCSRFFHQVFPFRKKNFFRPRERERERERNFLLIFSERIERERRKKEREKRKKEREKRKLFERCGQEHTSGKFPRTHS